MPVNRNALIRYKTIDQCLQNRYRNWTLEDLIEACSEALYEYEGIEKGVSRRTVQSDIQMMRSDKLGYRAPIVVRDRKYYTYADPDYSITNIPLTDQDLHKLTEVVEFLKQFRGFSHFRELGGMVQKLEDHVHSQKEQQGPVIDFEKNDNLRGLEYLDALYQAILNKRVLHIQYQSFKARQAQHFDFSPYLLKEYKNRWFLIGKRPDRAAVINLALDRMQDLQPSTAPFESSPHFSPAEHFKHNIGVTVNGGLKIQEVLLRVQHRQAPYLLTKPLHWSQEEVGRDYYGILLALRVRHNFELEKEILSFGEGVTVLAPERLRRSIQQRLRDAAEHYDNELNEKSLRRLHKSLEFRGSYVLRKVYSRREVQKIRKLIETYRDERSIEATTLPALFEQLPQLPTLLWTPNLQKIVETIAPGAHCVRAIYYERGKRIAGDTQWRQHQRIKVAQQKAVRGYRDWFETADGFEVCPPDPIAFGRFCLRIHLDPSDTGHGALQVLPGSHRLRHQAEGIATISQNSIPQVCTVPEGGIHVFHPMILHALEPEKGGQQRPQRLVFLEFSTHQLDGGLRWAEWVDLATTPPPQGPKNGS
ncbi:MAG: WYL domain-containing protein [Bacteroidota bacterium]